MPPTPPAAHGRPPAGRKNGFPSRRWVNALFVHTGERFKNLYVEDGAYIAPAVTQFSWVCRDVRANAMKLLDPRLMDLLFVLHWKYCKDEIRIFSGYRTPETNSKLEGAALNSQHVVAKALDIHLPGMDNEEVARSFRTIVYGGVGNVPAEGLHARRHQRLAALGRLTIAARPFGAAGVRRRGALCHRH